MVSPLITVPKNSQATSVVARAGTLAEKGIFPFLQARTPWMADGCDCGANSAKPVGHARWCEVRVDWSYGDE